MAESTSSTAAILDASRVLLVARQQEIQKRKLTLMGLTIGNLSSADSVQQTLPFATRSSPELDEALDAVRDKFGGSAIGRAALVGHEHGLSAPMLPDPK